MSVNSKIKLELLAPAKDKNCAKEAILAGADAIYIGPPISEKAMAPHSSILAWKILWMEEPGRPWGR